MKPEVRTLIQASGEHAKKQGRRIGRFVDNMEESDKDTPGNKTRKNAEWEI